MIILGNKYKITKKEEKKLLQQVNSIHYINIHSLNDEEIIKEIKKNITDVGCLVLNLEKEISIHLKAFLEELDYNNIQIMLFSEFTAKFFNRCYLDFNEYNYDVYGQIHHNEKKEIVKRIFDVIFSVSALVLLSPLFLVIAIMIKMKSPEGPVFFGHQRIGKNGKFFRVYKFRTMVPDAEERLKKLLDSNLKLKEEFEKDFKLKNDPRIIPGIGNFMRKSSLDELPQFFNSLIGNMSVVGPRPIVEKELEKYGKYAKKLLSVKPGVTGLWQVSGRNDIDYNKRIELDMEYIDNQSLWLDIKIIMKTILVMVFKKGAY